MLILSQDKETICNFDNIIELKAISGGYNYACYIESYNIDGSSSTIGSYDTEDRAKEVLQEIIDDYTNSIDYMYNQTLLIGELEEYREGLVYRMPEK